MPCVFVSLTESPLPKDADPMTPIRNIPSGVQLTLKVLIYSDSAPMCVVAVPQGELRIRKAL